MRTKTLALTAALGVLGTAASMAQVYSQNAVGFYTLNMVPGFNLIANQLDNGDNNINTIIPANAPVPDGASILKWDTSSQSFLDDPAFNATFFAGFGWVDGDLNPSAVELAAGEGAFVQLGDAASVVLVGDVPQGSLSKGLVEGWQLISQLTPQSIGLGDGTGADDLPAADTDAMLFWSAANQDYRLPGAAVPGGLTFFDGFGWVDDDLNIVDPTPAIGEAVFYNRAAGAGPADWTRDFSVNP
jgi:hypothetical protein